MGGLTMTSTRGQHLIGTVLGSCVLERLLGYGGSSAVFLAQQHTPKRKVAVKVFLPRSTMDAQMRRDFYKRFLREAESASQLDHPNILPIYSYGEQDGLPYIIMPYMSGGTLSEYIAKHGPLSLKEAQWHLEQMASALDYAHAHGCIHCDVKPANILLDGDRRIMLADFGIARLSPSVESNETQPATKEAEALMGTPDYISPEQAFGQPLDGRSDIYSLGITLFFLLAKQLPFKAESTIALALMHIHESPPSLCPVRADISPVIDSVVRKALAKSTDQRFQTAGAFSIAFTQAIELAQTSSADRRSAENTGFIFDGPEPIVLVPQPIVQVKPLSARAPRSSRLFSVPRLAIIAAVLFVLIGGTVAATTLVFHRLPVPPPGVQTSLASGIDKPTTDTLTNENSWPLSSTFFFGKQNQQYHILNKSDQNVAMALYSDHQYHDFRLTVTMKQLHGNHDGSDYYGVVFRSTADQSHYYLFEIETSGKGQYVFWRYDGNNKWKQLASGPVSSLLRGMGKSNTATIEAHGATFTFSVNNKPLSTPVTDSSSGALTSGEVGLYVEQQDAEVEFSHLYIDIPK